MDKHSPKAALARAIERIGGASATGRALNITPQAVGQWARAPAERTLEIERLSGVSRHELRPDLYPVEQARAAS